MKKVLGAVVKMLAVSAIVEIEGVDLSCVTVEKEPVHSLVVERVRPVRI